MLTHIFVTHHHADHTNGNFSLKSETDCLIVGPRKEAKKILGIDIKVDESQSFLFGSFKINVLETPGYTSGHVAYWVSDANVTFVGDTFFQWGVVEFSKIQ
ncbi:MAG: Hydroxyacylglutathione hydrolase [Hyphomicrobiaceae bacterium hypho_1]